VRLGLALSGGAFYGIMHIGVLQALEQLHLRPAVLAGSSAGALVAGLYAAGVGPERLATLASLLARRPIASLSPNWRGYLGLLRHRPLTGIFDARRVEDVVWLTTGNPPLRAIPVPLGVTAFDLRRGRRVLYTSVSPPPPGFSNEGRLASVLRASISLPGLITPVEVGDALLVDGGVGDDLPVDVCRRLGADYIIGVEIPPAALPPDPDLFAIAAAALGALIRETSSLRAAPDLLITPSTADLPRWPDARLYLQRGREATLKALVAGLPEQLRNRVRRNRR
jgi:NTE family protein